MASKDLLTLNEVAERKCISRRTLERMRTVIGRPRVERVSASRVAVPASELQQWDEIVSLYASACRGAR